MATAASLALDPRLTAEGVERSNWKRAWQLAVSHAAHAEVLHLEEFLDAVLGAFAADAGFLHAAEGRDLGGDEAGVDAGHAGLDRKSVVLGKRVSVRVDLGGRRFIKKKKTKCR